jgi:hypothetical protein
MPDHEPYPQAAPYGHLRPRQSLREMFGAVVSGTPWHVRIPMKKDSASSTGQSPLPPRLAPETTKPKIGWEKENVSRSTLPVRLLDFRGHREVRRDWADLLGEELLILIVVTDPIPEKGVVLENRQGSVACANANRPDGPALLRPQGGMTRVALPKAICGTRPAFDIRRKRAVRRPEVTRCR